MKEEKIKTITNLFEGSEIRSIWDSEREEYYFSVVDVIGALTDSSNPRNYWNMLKKRLIEEEKSQLYTSCVRLKMKAQDGKLRETDTLDTKGILRLIESVPSPKAEPFKLWLANLGRGMTASEYKKFKGLRKESLRDNMTDLEVALTDLGELATRELAKEYKPYGMDANKKIANIGGSIADNTRKDLENKLGKSIVSENNSLNYQYKEDNLIESK